MHYVASVTQHNVSEVPVVTVFIYSVFSFRYSPDITLNSSTAA